jgi:predicted nicotinamide N-methyase
MFRAEHSKLSDKDKSATGPYKNRVREQVMKSGDRPPPTPPPEQVLDRLGPLTRERVRVEGRSFFIIRPAQADHLLDVPAIRSAFLADEYMPYWTDLWPAARMLAKAVLRERWQPGLEALEIGCGLGLPGIAALAAGLRVTFSDYDATALRFAADNARLNGFEDFRTLQLDWRYPPAGLVFPVLLGADLIYELRNVEPLVKLIKTVLAPAGLCLLTDQDRVPAVALREALQEHGLDYTTRLMRAGEPGGRRFKGTLYRINHCCARESDSLVRVNR